MVVRTTVTQITRKSLKTNETSQEMTMKYTKITLTLIQTTNFLKKSHSVLILYQDRETPPPQSQKRSAPLQHIIAGEAQKKQDLYSPHEAHGLMAAILQD